MQVDIFQWIGKCFFKIDRQWKINSKNLEFLFVSFDDISTDRCEIMWTVFGQRSFEEVLQWLEGIRWKKLGLLFAVPVLEYLINDSFLSLSLWSGFYQKLSFFEQNTERTGVGAGNSTRKLVHSIHLHAFHVHDTRLNFHLEFKSRFTQTPVIMSLELDHTTFKVIDSFRNI